MEVRLPPIQYANIMKNKITWFLALVVVILAAALWFSYHNVAKPAVNGAKPAATGIGPAISPNTVPMSVVSVTQSDSFYDIQAEYPQFTGIDPAFNQKISSLVTSQIDSFKKEAKDNFDARNATKGLKGSNIHRL